MKSVTLTLAVILVLAVLAAWAGWWTFTASENESNIRIDTAEIRQDTAETMEDAAAWTQRTGEKIDESVDIDIESDEPETAQRSGVGPAAQPADTPVAGQQP